MGNVKLRKIIIISIVLLQICHMAYAPIALNKKRTVTAEFDSEDEVPEKSILRRKSMDDARDVARPLRPRPRPIVAESDSEDEVPEQSKLRRNSMVEARDVARPLRPRPRPILAESDSEDEVPEQSKLRRNSMVEAIDVARPLRPRPRPIVAESDSEDEVPEDENVPGGMKTKTRKIKIGSDIFNLSAELLSEGDHNVNEDDLESHLQNFMTRNGLKELEDAEGKPVLPKDISDAGQTLSQLVNKALAEKKVINPKPKPAEGAARLRMSESIRRNLEPRTNTKPRTQPVVEQVEEVDPRKLREEDTSDEELKVKKIVNQGEHNKRQQELYKKLIKIYAPQIIVHERSKHRHCSLPTHHHYRKINEPKEFGLDKIKDMGRDDFDVNSKYSKVQNNHVGLPHPPPVPPKRRPVSEKWEDLSRVAFVYEDEEGEEEELPPRRRAQPNELYEMADEQQEVQRMKKDVSGNQRWVKGVFGQGSSRDRGYESATDAEEREEEEDEENDKRYAIENAKVAREDAYEYDEEFEDEENNRRAVAQRDQDDANDFYDPAENEDEEEKPLIGKGSARRSQRSFPVRRSTASAYKRLSKNTPRSKSSQPSRQRFARE